MLLLQKKRKIAAPLSSSNDVIFVCINARVCAYRNKYAYINVICIDTHNLTDMYTSLINICVHTHVHPEWIVFASWKWLTLPERGAAEREWFYGYSLISQLRINFAVNSVQTCTVERLLLALPKTGDNRWVWEDRRAQWGNWTGLTKSLTPSPWQCGVCVGHCGDSDDQNSKRGLTKDVLGGKAGGQYLD